MTALTSAYNCSNTANKNNMMMMMMNHPSGTNSPQYDTSMGSNTRTDIQLPLQSIGSSSSTLTMPHKPSFVPLVAVNSTRGGSNSVDNNNNIKNQANALIPVPHEPQAAADGTIRVPSGSGYRIMTPFPWRLHEMLEEIEEKNLGWIVSWLPGGRAFQVHSPEKFADDIIPKYFRHTRYKSFQRQLYLYGFRSLEVSSLSRGAYFHPFFVRENRSLCRFIERPKSTSGKASSSDDSSPTTTPKPETRRKRSKKTTKTEEVSSSTSTTKEEQPMEVGTSELNPAGAMSLFSLSGLNMGQTFSTDTIKCDNLTLDFPTQLPLEPLSSPATMWGFPNAVSVDGTTTRSSSSPSSSPDMFSNDSNDDAPLFMERFEDRFDWDDLNGLATSNILDMTDLTPLNESLKNMSVETLLQRLEPFSDDIINLFGQGHAFVPQTIG